MMLPLPRLTAASLIDYLALGLGVAVGAAIFSAPMQSIQDAISKKN
jgi:hypothetical protein